MLSCVLCVTFQSNYFPFDAEILVWKWALCVGDHGASLKKSCVFFLTRRNISHLSSARLFFCTHWTDSWGTANGKLMFFKVVIVVVFLAKICFDFLLFCQRWVFLGTVECPDCGPAWHIRGGEEIHGDSGKMCCLFTPSTESYIWGGSVLKGELLFRPLHQVRFQAEEPSCLGGGQCPDCRAAWVVGCDVGTYTTLGLHWALDLPPRWPRFFPFQQLQHLYHNVPNLAQFSRGRPLGSGWRLLCHRRFEINKNPKSNVTTIFLFTSSNVLPHKRMGGGGSFVCLGHATFAAEPPFEAMYVEDPSPTGTVYLLGHDTSGVMVWKAYWIGILVGRPLRWQSALVPSCVTRGFALLLVLGLRSLSRRQHWALLLISCLPPKQTVSGFMCWGHCVYTVRNCTDQWQFWQNLSYHNLSQQRILVLGVYGPWWHWLNTTQRRLTDGLRFLLDPWGW